MLKPVEPVAFKQDDEQQRIGVLPTHGSLPAREYKIKSMSSFELIGVISSVKGPLVAQVQ